MNIIIAGASRGIGIELVKGFAKLKGHSILAISRNIEPLEKLKENYKQTSDQSEIIPVKFDLGDCDFNTGLLPQIQGKMKTVDVLIYNAGLLVNKPFIEMTTSDFDGQFNVNVKGAFQLVSLLVELFSPNAHVLTISSMGGYQGSAKFPGLSLYSASKAALAVLTECMAEEFKSQQISCNCLALGAVQTEMLAEAFPGYEAPLSPQKMGEFILDFSLNGHRFFNGKILPVSISTP